MAASMETDSVTLTQHSKLPVLLGSRTNEHASTYASAKDRNVALETEMVCKQQYDPGLACPPLAPAA